VSSLLTLAIVASFRTTTCYLVTADPSITVIIFRPAVFSTLCEHTDLLKNAESAFAKTPWT